MKIRCGDNLRSTIDDGAPNAVYTLDRDVVAVGDYTFSKPCTIRSVASPPAGTRVDPALVGPTLRGQFQVDVPGVVLEGVRIEGTNRDRAIAEIYGAGFVLDRCYVTGVDGGQRRAFYLGAQATFRDSWIDNVIYPGNGDTQAIVAERDAHDVVIDNCFLEAAGEVVMVGGGPCFAESRMCRNWTITRSVLSKNLKWRAQPYTAKNIFELKAIKGCTMTQTVLRHSWADAQTGFAIVLTPRNQDDQGADTFVTVEDVRFQDVTIQGCAGGISLLGRDDIHVSQPMRGITFRNVAIVDLSRHTWGHGGNGRTVQILGAVQDLVFDGLDVQAGPDNDQATDPDARSAVDSAILFEARGDDRCGGFVMRNARLAEGSYGVHCTGAVSSPGGMPALEAAAPGYQWQAVLMQRGGVRSFTYPPGTVLVG